MKLNNSCCSTASSSSGLILGKAVSFFYLAQAIWLYLVCVRFIFDHWNELRCSCRLVSFQRLLQVFQDTSVGFLCSLGLLLFGIELFWLGYLNVMILCLRQFDMSRCVCQRHCTYSLDIGGFYVIFWQSILRLVFVLMLLELKLLVQGFDLPLLVHLVGIYVVVGGSLFGHSRSWFTRFCGVGSLSLVSFSLSQALWRLLLTDYTLAGFTSAAHVVACWLIAFPLRRFTI